MEVEVPPTAARVSLVRASTTTLEVCWSPTPTAQAYLLEVQKIEQPPQTQPQAIPVAIAKKQPINTIAPAQTSKFWFQRFLNQIIQAKAMHIK